MSTPTTDDRRLALLAAINAVENLTADLISAELRELEPLFREDISRTASAAQAAQSAIPPILSQIAAITSEVDHCTGRVSEYQSDITGGTDAETRVNARRWYQEWSDELDRLDEKKGLLERDLGEAQAVYGAARNEADKALSRLVDLAQAISNPFTHPAAQDMPAYRQFRSPQTWQIILQGDRKHPGTDQSMAQLAELASIAGFKLVPDDQQTRKMWDEYSERKLSEFQRFPSGQDVINASHAIHERIAGDKKHRDHVEDYRTPGLRIPVRDEMQVPWRNTT